VYQRTVRALEHLAVERTGLLLCGGVNAQRVGSLTDPNTRRGKSYRLREEKFLKPSGDSAPKNKHAWRKTGA
jgi:hypothetical protein